MDCGALDEAEEAFGGFVIAGGDAPAFAASLSTADSTDTDDVDIVFDIQIGAADITITDLAARFVNTAGVVSAYYVLGGYAATPTLSSWTLWDSTDLTGTAGYAGWDIAIRQPDMTFRFVPALWHDDRGL
ncbi:MAG: hypothetical protein ACJAVR_002361 [Paracoccaceae bacterium]|jgi:hypothetical protein